MFNAYHTLDAQNSMREALRENSGRLAFAYGMVETIGWGEVEIATCIDFEVSFIEQPIVSYGFSLDGDELVDTRFPRCSGGVTRWRQNGNDHYVGAWVFVTVDTKSPYISTTENEPNYTIDHSFTFSGIALKSVSPYLADGI
jgi:hypothetical protein